MKGRNMRENMQDRMLLVTQGFPFDECERAFLEVEFEELTKRFQMNVLANNVTGKIVHKFPKDIPCWRYHIGKLNIFRLPAQLRYPEVRKDIVSCWSAMKTRGKVRTTIRILAYSLRAEELCHQIEEIVEQQNINFIYTYWCTQATVAAVRLKKRYPQLKVVTRFHGYDLYRERVAGNWQPLRPFIAGNANLLVFACKRGRAYFLAQWPGEWEKCSIVSYLGTRAMQRVIPKNTDKLVIVSCSNLIPLKRVHMIIEALALLPDQIQVEWHHLGDGSEREKLEKLAAEKLTPKPHVSWKFWGAMPHDEIETVYQKISPDLFITTSSTEGLPVSVQESFAMGIPAIGTDVGGMAELISNRETGYLLPADFDLFEAAHCIESYGKLSAAEKKSMAENALNKWKKHFSAEKNAKKFAEILKRMGQ